MEISIVEIKVDSFKSPKFILNEYFFLRKLCVVGLCLLYSWIFLCDFHYLKIENFFIKITFYWNLFVWSSFLIFKQLKKPYKIF